LLIEIYINTLQIITIKIRCIVPQGSMVKKRRSQLISTKVIRAMIGVLFVLSLLSLLFSTYFIISAKENGEEISPNSQSKGVASIVIQPPQEQNAVSGLQKGE